MPSIFANSSLSVSFDAGTKDPAGKLRVSNAHILLSSQLTYNDNPLIWNSVHVTGGYHQHISAESYVQMIVPTTNGARVTRQTKEYFLYRAGQSMSILLSFAGMNSIANVSKRVGYFDNNDGSFFLVDGDGAAIVKRSSSSGSLITTTIRQTDWNVDPLDGSGASGITLDITKAQVFFIDFLWLGTGEVRLGFEIDGENHIVHKFQHGNREDRAYTRTGSLPVRYEIENTGTSAGASMRQGCSSVVREGGDEKEGIPVHFETFNSSLTATTTARTALALRKRDQFKTAGVDLKKVSVLNRGNALIAWRAYINPVLSGSLSGWTGVSNSATEVSQSQIVLTSGGLEIAGGWVDSSRPVAEASNFAIDNALTLGTQADGSSDVVVIVVRSISGTQSVDISFNWKEFY